MRTSMAALGKAVRSAVSSGRHEMTKGMRNTRSIGQDIEWWLKVSEVQIPGTKNALYRAFLDSLLWSLAYPSLSMSLDMRCKCYINCDYSAGHILILKASTVSEFLGKE